MATIAFSKDVKRLSSKRCVDLEESDEEGLHIFSNDSGSVHVVSTDRVTNTDWVVDEEEMVLVIPGNIYWNSLKGAVGVGHDCVRTEFIELTKTVSTAWTSLQPKEQWCGVVERCSGVCGTTSSVKPVEIFGLGGRVHGDVAGSELTDERNA